MSSLIYMKVTGVNQGLISTGCGSTPSIGNKAQQGHEDEIFIHSVQHLMTRGQHVKHHPLTIIKPIDKASPLLAKSINDNEMLTCELYFYRTSENGGLERYYVIRLGRAKIETIRCDYPHNVNSNHISPQEVLSIAYQNISWRNIVCSTESYSLWDERIY